MRRADRLFQIVQFMRTRRVTTANWLAQRLEVSERTIYRDIRDLMNTGVNIEGEAGVGYVIRKGFDLPPLMFTKEETDARIFNRNQVSAFNIPSDTKVSDFQNIKLDILICAYKEGCLPGEYIAATSKAKFRVGAFNQSKTNYYELMINTGTNEELKYLLQQVLYFLKVIKV